MGWPRKAANGTLFLWASSVPLKKKNIDTAGTKPVWVPKWDFSGCESLGKPSTVLVQAEKKERQKVLFYKGTGDGGCWKMVAQKGRLLRSHGGVWPSCPLPSPHQHCCPRSPKLLLPVPAPRFSHLLALSAAYSPGASKASVRRRVRNSCFSALPARTPSLQGRVNGLFSSLRVSMAPGPRPGT